MKLPVEFQPIIGHFERAVTRFSEHEVADAIRGRIREAEHSGQPIRLEMEAEWMAFALMADYPEARSAWGAYFGPVMVWKTKEGLTVESPSVERISGAVLDYWRERLG